ncbi:MAG: helix-turn-helix domain-containing protein [Flammeovirgaceae bacterium]
MEKASKLFITFGKNLRGQRLERKMTQERLAELADIDRTYIYRLEAGVRLPSIQVLARLASAFGQTPGQF